MQAKMQLLREICPKAINAFVQVCLFVLKTGKHKNTDKYIEEK